MTGQAKLCLSLYILYTLLIHVHTNMHTSFSFAVANTLNISDCWVCSHVPADQTGALPLRVNPLNGTEIKTPIWAGSGYNESYTWKHTGMKIWGYLRVVQPPLGDICYMCNGTKGPYIGHSTCKYDIVTNGAFRNYKNGTREWLPNYTLSNFTGDGGEDPGYYAVWTMSTQCKKFLPALAGHYFVCGHRAYHVLPADYAGKCYIARGVPYVEIYKGSIPGRIRNRRDDSWRPKESTRFFMILFPGYGVAENARSIRILAGIVEKFANATIKAIDSLNQEVGEMRQMILQNRMALDFVLASKGGTCALIGSKCCTYIKDRTQDVEHNLEDMQQAVEQMHIEKTTNWWDFLTGWLPNWNWLRALIMMLLIVLAILAILSCIIPCCLKCFSQRIQAMFQTTSSDTILLLDNNSAITDCISEAERGEMKG